MWYEALAFCRWLEERLADSRQPLEGKAATVELGHLLAAKGYRLTLPGEAEWEKAARGGEKRRYPWGDNPDPNRANYEDTGLGNTSPVGCFPGGASPYGCREMSGNVWEWTRSLWGFDYPYDPADGREDFAAGINVGRVLRGGSYYDDGMSLRCGSRFRYNPIRSNYFYGFRVAASPFISGL